MAEFSLLARRRTQKDSPRKYSGRRSWKPFYPLPRQRRAVGSEHRWRGEAQVATDSLRNARSDNSVDLLVSPRSQVDRRSYQALMNGA